MGNRVFKITFNEREERAALINSILLVFDTARILGDRAVMVADVSLDKVEMKMGNIVDSYNDFKNNGNDNWEYFNWSVEEIQ